MPGPFETVLWVLSFVLQVGVAVAAALRRSLTRYYTLIFYIFANAVVNVLQFYVLQTYGFHTNTYMYFYYYSETLLVVILFFAIITLCQHVFQEMTVSRYVRGGAAMMLLTTALFSYLAIQKYNDHLTDRFVVQLGQNLYFVGVVLTYLLWGVVMQLRETRVRTLQFVFSLGINFSVLAATYALRNLFPKLAVILAPIPQIASVFLAGSWLYAFWNVAEDARLATSRITAGAGSGGH